MKPVKKQDKAISEIIGAILLFAIASVLLTSFILWYVPNTGANNDISYQGNTQSAFSSLNSKILGNSVKVGDQITQTIPLGIGGTPPFIPVKSTDLYYSHNFRANLSYSLQVNYTHILHKKTNSKVACANTSISHIMNNNIVESKSKFNVIFQENGLKSGYYWTVNINDIKKSSSSTDQISFCLSEGSYSYRISSSKPYCESNPAEGTIDLNSGNFDVNVVFSSNVNQSIVSEDYGSQSSINFVNSVHLASYTNTTNSNANSSNSNEQQINNWLGNKSTGMFLGNRFYYKLASQEFRVEYPFTSVNFVQFYLEPNLEYANQYFQGNSHIYINVGQSPWSHKIPGSSAYLTIPKNVTGSSYGQGGIMEKVNLKNCILLGRQHPYERNYYLNFWEAINESSNSKASSSSTFSIKFNNTGTGYGYGPNEFIGTANDNSLNIGTEGAISCTAKIHCSPTHPPINTKSDKTNDAYNCFKITSDGETSSNPYFYRIGYIPNCGSDTLYLREDGLNSSMLSKKAWHICVDDQLYNIRGQGLTIRNLSNFEYEFSVPQYGGKTPTIGNGFISISSGNNTLVVNFINNTGSLANYWAISYMGVQSFHLAKMTKINYVSFYLYNYSSSPASTNREKNPTDHIRVSIYNTNSGSEAFRYSKTMRINNTGYFRMALNKGKKGNYYNISPGIYYICMKDVNRTGFPSYSGSIGWGFTTMGGYDSYLQAVCNDNLMKNVNNSRSSIVTPYDVGSPSIFSASNQSFIYSVGYSVKSIAGKSEYSILSNSCVVMGSINSYGQTSFVSNELFALQDGISIQCGKGISYVPTNPLPIRIENNHGAISLISNVYNMGILSSIPSSVSGTGSTMVSMNENFSKSLNLTCGNEFYIHNSDQKITGLSLLSYHYNVSTSYSAYWAKVLSMEMGNIKGNPYNFTAFSSFHFEKLGNMEIISLTHMDHRLYSVSFKDMGFKIDSL